MSMALGTTSLQPRFEDPREIPENRLREGSIYRLLGDEGDCLFPGGPREKDCVFRIARTVAKDRVISTVDPEARHGRKSKSRRFDDYRRHAVLAPNSELIDDVVVTPANSPDRDALPALVEPPPRARRAARDRRRRRPRRRRHMRGSEGRRDHRRGPRAPPVRSATGGFTKDRFAVEPDTGTVTCPAAQTVALRFNRHGAGGGPLGPALWRLSSDKSVHHATTRPQRRRSSPGRSTAASPRRAASPRLVGVLPSRSSDGRTKDRPLCSSRLGRTTSPHLRTAALPPMSTRRPF